MADTGDELMAQPMTHPDGSIAMATLDDGHRYIACNVQVGHTFCGELIDVTGMDITPETDIDCGNPANHVGPTGIDAIVP
jgi:hypothetical protein